MDWTATFWTGNEAVLACANAGLASKLTEMSNSAVNAKLRVGAGRVPSIWEQNTRA
jgi:hypothetical protein